MDSSLISPSAAVRFVEDVLGVSNFREKVQACRKTTLNELIIRIEEKIPFQNISYLSISYPQEITPLTLQKNIECCMSLEGGPCAAIASFSNVLLNALGFKVYSTVASFPVWGCTNHLVNIVVDLETPGDKFLVDTSFGYPTFGTVPLDIPDDGETPVISESFVTYKVIRKGDLYIRCHKSKPNAQFPYMVDDTWLKTYCFKLVPYEADQAQFLVANTNYKDPECIFRSCLRAIRFRDRKAIIVRDFVLSLETNEGRLQNTKFTSLSDIEAALNEFFPTIPPQKVKKALQYWDMMKKAKI